MTFQIRLFTVPYLDWERFLNDFVQGELKVKQSFYNEITLEDLQNLIKLQEQNQWKGTTAEMSPGLPGSLGSVTENVLDSGGSLLTRTT